MDLRTWDNVTKHEKSYNWIGFDEGSQSGSADLACRGGASCKWKFVFVFVFVFVFAFVFASAKQLHIIIVCKKQMFSTQTSIRLISLSLTAVI